MAELETETDQSRARIQINPRRRTLCCNMLMTESRRTINRNHQRVKISRAEIVRPNLHAREKQLALRDTCSSERYLSFLTKTFELRPLCSYFSRREGGKSSGVPSTKPPLD